MAAHMAGFVGARLNGIDARGFTPPSGRARSVATARGPLFRVAPSARTDQRNTDGDSPRNTTCPGGQSGLGGWHF